ncbi:MAG: glutamate 5-kinase [Candidatus Ancaeobacter aquaticus]|nr:glutamate 5-kinase [Candidatus Ancaeobacter aquaticus]
MHELNQKFREDILRKVKRIVVKIGTNVLTDSKGLIDKKQIAHIAQQVVDLKKRGYEVVLVSSAAIGAGMGELKIKSRPKSLPQLQAVASVGQCALMREYHHYFKELGENTAQILLINDDLKVRTRHINIRNTICNLLTLNVIPIVNENDTVSTDEIKFGDNDYLSALVTNLIKAQMLVMLTNVDGLIDCSQTGDVRNGHVVSIVESVDQKVEELCHVKKSQLGTGGMKSKLKAIKNVNRAGEAAVIVNGLQNNILIDLFEGKDLGTIFLPKKGKMAGRKRWIAFFVTPAGTITIDEGAEHALKGGGKSLLASGIIDCDGDFLKGDTVSVLNTQGEEMGRGISYYSVSEVQKIKKLKTKDIEKVLGKKEHDEVIHRNHLVLL